MDKLRILTLAFLFAISIASLSLSSTDIALIVGDRKVTMDQYLFNLKRYEDSYRAYYGSKFDAEIEKKMKKKLVDDLVRSEIFLAEAEGRGISSKTFISEEEIEDYIMKDPVFFTDGKFDPKKYDSAKISTEVNMSALRNDADRFLSYEQRRLVVPSKVIKAIKDDVTIDDNEVLSEYTRTNELMRVKYIAVDPMKYEVNLKINEDKVKDYYGGHRDAFKMGETRRYKVIYFDPKNYLDMVFISDPMLAGYYEKKKDEFKSPVRAKVRFALFNYGDYTGQINKFDVNPREYYEQNLDRFLEPARLKVRYIFIKYNKADLDSKIRAEDKLRNVINEMKSGVSFISLAKKYSDDPATADSGGDLGYVDKGKLQEPFNSVLFTLNKGDISGVIETDRGYHIMLVEDKVEERTKFYPEVKDEIEKEILNESARPLAFLDAKRFMIEAKRAGFEGYAQKKTLPVYQTDYFGGSDKIPLIGKNQNFTDTAMSISSGEVSDIIEYDKGYAVFQLIDRTTLEYRSFEAARADIEDKIKQNNSMIFAEKDAEHVRDVLQAGMSLDEIESSNIRIKVFASDRTADRNVTANGCGLKYEWPEGQDNIGSVSEIIMRPEGYYLVLLSAKQPPHYPDINVISKEVAAMLAREYGEKMADDEAKRIYAKVVSGTSMEDAASAEGLAVNDAGPFTSRDYVIDGRYMVDLIRECFKLNVGDVSMVRNIDNYCVVKVMFKGIDREAFEKNRPKIAAEILRQKRKEYADKWFDDKLKETSVVVKVE